MQDSFLVLESSWIYAGHLPTGPKCRMRLPKEEQKGHQDNRNKKIISWLSFPVDLDGHAASKEKFACHD